MVQKADNFSVRVLAVANMIFFVAMRCVFLPIMVVTLPLPSQVVRVFPEEVVGILQWVSEIGDLRLPHTNGVTDLVNSMYPD